MPPDGERHGGHSHRGLFAQWVVAIIVGHTVGAALAVMLFGLAMNLTLHALLVPFELLACCSLPLPALGLWVRAAREKPDSYAVRSALFCLAYGTLVAIALAISSLRLGLARRAGISGSAGAFAVGGLLLASGIVYFGARPRYSKRQR